MGGSEVNDRAYPSVAMKRLEPETQIVINGLKKELNLFEQDNEKENQ